MLGVFAFTSILALAEVAPVDGPASPLVQAFSRAGRTYLLFPDHASAPDRRWTALDVEKARAEAARRGRSFLVEVRGAGADGALLAEEALPVLSGLNVARAGKRPKPSDAAPAYAVVDGRPLAPGTGLAVLVPSVPGRRCFRVFERVKNERNLLGEACADEELGPGEFVLQGPAERRAFQGVPGVEVERYVRWEAPPFANRLRAVDYVAAVPRGPVDELRAAGLYLHAWGGDVDEGYGVWHGVEQGALLLASNQEPYDWWSGYRSDLDLAPEGAAAPGTTPASVVEPTVEPYTSRRLLAFLDFAASRYPIDPARVFVAGTSMGGTGATALWAREGDRLAWARSDVGVHVPALAPAFRRSFAEAWGDPPPFAAFDHAAFVREHPGRSFPLLVFANGTNDEKIGWRQAVTLLAALQEARQPHVFVFGPKGHAERALLPGGGRKGIPVDVRLGRPVPAFTRCSLDDVGATQSGRPPKGRGQVNLWLLWEAGAETADVVELDVWLASGAPKGSAIVDVTPRRLSRLVPAPGDRFAFTVTDAGGAVADERVLVVDEHGRITAPEVKVSRQRSHLRFARTR